MPLLTNREIDDIERNLGITLPGLYRKLLVMEGFGPLGDAEIYHPSDVPELYGPLFDDPSQLFDPYFPFGCHNRRQEIWVIDASTEKAASIWHETVPSDWPDEEWLPYEVWGLRYLGPEVG